MTVSLHKKGKEVLVLFCLYHHSVKLNMSDNICLLTFTSITPGVCSLPSSSEILGKSLRTPEAINKQKPLMAKPIHHPCHLCILAIEWVHC